MAKIAVLWNNFTSTLAYNDDWLDALKKYSLCHVTDYNTQELSTRDSIKIMYNYDYIIFMHSTNSNGFRLPRLFMLGALKLRTAKIIMFVGNEYKLMPEKLRFLKENSVEFVVSQLPQDSANWLYENTCANVISLPHALNDQMFKAKRKITDRKIHLGNRMHKYPLYLGDNERNSIINIMDYLRADFVIDFSTDPEDRLGRDAWASFLATCKATISSEAGAKFLERDDKLRLAINNYLKEFPETKYEDLESLYFSKYSRQSVSGKVIAARHFEAIGTKTCQILFAGRYNDILLPNEHFILLRSDLQNLDEVKENLKDDRYMQEIADHALEHVLSSHTHAHRIGQLFSIIQ